VATRRPDLVIVAANKPVSDGGGLALCTVEPGRRLQVAHAGAWCYWRKYPMGKGLLMWLIGIPIPIILLLWILGYLH
jgi:hypothetical protein